MNILIGAFFVISQLKCSNSSNFRHQESLGGRNVFSREALQNPSQHAREMFIRLPTLTQLPAPGEVYTL